MNHETSNDLEEGLATPEVLEEWLGRDSITLWDAALIANGASPGTDGTALSTSLRDAVYATEEILDRSLRLETAKTLARRGLYDIKAVFGELAKTGHSFPPSIRSSLQQAGLIPKRFRSGRPRHGNTEVNEDKRIQVMHAMIRVLADPKLHASCRKDGDAGGPVVGIDLARTIIANEHRLFADGKSPQKSETIAKLFREIVSPQVT